MDSGVYAPRNPGVAVNYVVNWTYGGDTSRGTKYPGYAAIHGCENDTVTFRFLGGRHNVVQLSATATSERPCGRCLLAWLAALAAHDRMSATSGPAGPGLLDTHEAVSTSLLACEGAGPGLIWRFACAAIRVHSRRMHALSSLTSTRSACRCLRLCQRHGSLAGKQLAPHLRDALHQEVRLLQHRRLAGAASADPHSTLTLRLTSADPG